MVRIERTDGGLRAVDAAKNAIEVGGDWAETDREGSIPHRTEVGVPDRGVEATVTGETTRLEFPSAVAVVEEPGGRQVAEVCGNDEEHRLSPGEYVLRVNGSVVIYVRFEGAATLRLLPDGGLVVAFGHAVPVTLGFRSRVDAPDATVTVPPTPTGTARALSHLSAGHRSTAPDLSFPSVRDHPPRIEAGEAVAIPEEITGSTPDTGIELRLPETLAATFVAAPLAYYLGAAVIVEDRERPVCVAPEADLRREFSPLPDFQSEAAELLERVFFLDCLVRNAGPHGADLAATDLLDEVGVDPERAYDLPLAERLRVYLDAPFPSIRENLPDWHLAVYADPQPEHVETLPYLVSSLPHVYLPDAEPLADDELVSLALSDGYRAANPGESVSIDRVKPHLADARLHGWLADETPIDVFKLLPAAYRNRTNYLDRSGGPISVTVVMNDDEMAAESDRAADIYRKRAESLPIEVDVYRHLTRSQLADVLTEETDFLHYVGHCERDGLRCVDGNLSVADVESVAVQTFFLNACGSFHEGMDLVRQGSVAGGVTFREVLNEQAIRVGTTFVRLLVHGFSIWRALELARKRIMSGKDYAVVGDGTHTLAQSTTQIPGTLTVHPRDDGDYDMEVEAFSAASWWGAHYQVFIDDDARPQLVGARKTVTADPEKTREVLDHADVPVIYDGDLHWSSDLVDEL